MFDEHYGLQTAVVNRKKVMTRRFVNLKIQAEPGIYLEVEPDDMFIMYGKVYYTINGETQEVPKRYQPKYKPGEVVAIARSYDEIKEMYPDRMIPHEIGNPGKENKMYVKAMYMVDGIKIIDVFPHRINDITYDDCLDEGVFFCVFFYNSGIDYGYKVHGLKGTFGNPKDAFSALIDKIGGKGTWDKNPWCYAYRFEYINPEDLWKYQK
mgnify:CR=1 FL=1